MRKKFTMLLTALLCCVGVAKAEITNITITSLEGVNQGKYYTVDTPRSRWIVNDEGTALTSAKVLDVDPDDADSGQQFAFLTPDGENYYIYSVSAEKFLNSKNQFTIMNAEAIEFTEGTNTYSGRVKVSFKGISNSNINLNNDSQVQIDWWGTIDDGNACLITEAGELSLTDLVSSINAEFESLKNEANELAKNSILNGSEVLTNLNAALEDKSETDTWTEAFNAAYGLKKAIKDAEDYIQESIIYSSQKENPTLVRIKTARSGNPYWTYQHEGENAFKIRLESKDDANLYQLWVLMKDDNGNTLLYPYADPDNAVGYNDTNEDTDKIFNQSPSNTIFTLDNTKSNDSEFPYVFVTSDSKLVSNYSGVNYNLGIYNDANDPGTKVAIEVVEDFNNSKIYAYRQLLAKVNRSPVIYVAGTQVGEYTEASISILNEKIDAAKEILNAEEKSENEYNQAKNEIDNAINTLSYNMPEDGKFYVLKSAATNDYCKGALIYASSEDNCTYWSKEYNTDENLPISAIWQFESVDDGYNLKNVLTGKYFCDGTAYAAFSLGSTKGNVVLSVLGNRQFKIATNGSVLHAQSSGNKVVPYDDGMNSPSAWTVVEVENPGVAIVGDESYATLAEAIEDVEENGVVKLIADVNASEIITIDQAITLDGNGKTLTSTATGSNARAINVSGADGVKIQNLTIDAKGQRAINIIQNATNVTIENVTATAANYTVNVASSAPNAVVAIKNSTLTGLNTVNVGAAGAEVTVNKSTINTVDNNEAEGYGSLSLNKDAKGGKIVVTESTINITGDYPNESHKAVNQAENGEITIDGATEGVAVDVAYINYGTNWYGFETLEAAIAKANDGETVTLLRDITASEIIVINKAITLDGNGKTLTSTATGSNARAINVSGEAANGVKIQNLTIDAKGERAINIIQKATNVTIDNVTATSANYTVNLAGSAPNAVVAIKNSTLTGLNTVNVGAAGAKVTVNKSTINTVDNNEAEGYGSLSLNKDAKGGKIVVTESTINITGDYPNKSHKAVNQAENGEITIDGATEGVAVDVAYINYGTNWYGFETLEAAIDKANDGETVTLLRDITVSEIITIDKAITLDGNGKTLKATGCEFPIVVSQSAEVNFVNCNLTYTREFVEVNTWYALYVPFAIELTNDFLTKYEVAEFSEMTTESMTITMVKEGALAANTPYFIRVKADADEAATTLAITVDGAEFNASSTYLGNVATLNGVYTETVASSISGAYALSSGAFKQAKEEDQVLKPFRFYLMFNASQAAALRTISINVDGEEGTTAIDNSIFNNGETVVYDLQGRRVENPTKGIYIVNGVKVVIK